VDFKLSSDLCALIYWAFVLSLCEFSATLFRVGVGTRRMGEAGDFRVEWDFGNVTLLCYFVESDKACFVFMICECICLDVIVVLANDPLFVLLWKYDLCLIIYARNYVVRVVIKNAGM
jgi:hypothetical protein